MRNLDQRRLSPQRTEVRMLFLKKWFSRPEPLPPLAPAPIMIVGMHRSGTSFLTGTLQTAGLELGKHSEWNPHNLKGNRENPDIVELHDQILARCNAAWDRPPHGPVQWSESEQKNAKNLISNYPAGTRWGFKDPRALLLADGWLELIPNMRFIGIFRHPLAVCASLSARGGMPQAQALSLWDAYNQRLLALHEQNAFPLLCFDEDEETLHQKLNIILPELGLRSLSDERFFSSELKHHHSEDKAIPAAQTDLYNKLRLRAR